MYFLLFAMQNFALGKGDEEMISTLQYFSKVVDEVNPGGEKLLS